MVGTKRPSSNGDGPETRSHKVAKVSDTEKTPKGSAKGKARSKAIPHSTFQNEALPIHVHFTHTPATVIDDEEKQATSSDPGHISSLSILPTEFSTGSYGWKGARRITIELQNTEGQKKEKVQVMINVNATVVGSKGAADGDNDGEKKEEENDLVMEASSSKATP